MAEMLLVGRCPVCHVPDPEIDGQPDRDGNYRVCLDCGDLADEMQASGEFDDL